MGLIDNLFGVKCPYCSEKLEKKPGSKKKCPHCGQYIYIRGGEMKTETEKAFIDYSGRLGWLGVSASKLEKEQKKLSKRFGTRASANDTVWSVLNKSLTGKNHQQDAMIYREMVRLLEVEGKDSQDLSDQANAALMRAKKQADKKRRQSLIKELKENKKFQKESGIEFKVVIHTANDHLVCDNCRKASEKTYTVEQFLREMPIPEGCENPEGCRCGIAFSIK